jgi:hypothetical protein
VRKAAGREAAPADRKIERQKMATNMMQNRSKKERRRT